MQKQVVKVPILGLNQDDDDSLLPLGFFREIHNAIPRTGGLSKAGIQNVPGTTTRTNASLPAGTNTCIGAFEDKANNRIIYFIHNSNNNHGIWLFNPNLNTHTLVLQSQYLAFSTSYPINSCDSIEDILFWTDGLNEPRSIVVADAVAGGFYSNSADLNFQISLQKFSPTTTITAARSTDGSVVVNNVCRDSFQFAFRFVYRDNAMGAFSPLSKTVIADGVPNVNTTTNNRITLTVPVDAKVKPLAKKIQLAYSKNNDGQYFMFMEIDHDYSTSSYTKYFYNTESAVAVPPSDLAQVNFVPNTTRSVVVNNQRVVVTEDVYDNGFDDVGTASLTLTPSLWNGASADYIHLPGSTYTYGLVYFDGFMRTNGVVKTIPVSFGASFGSGQAGILGSTYNLLIGWSLSGNPPAWAKYYAIVRKKNSTISSIFQTAGLIMFYKREDDGTGPGTNEILDDGKIYYDAKASVPSVNAYGGNLYIKLPVNIPVSIDDSWRVRLVPNISQTKTEPVLQILGNKVIVGNFGVTDWSSTTQPYSYPMVQFEKLNEAPSETFYEIGTLYTITAGAHDTTSGTILGDHFTDASSFILTWDPIDKGTLAYANNNTGYTYLTTVITPSPTTKVVTRELQKTEVSSASRVGQIGSLFDLSGPPVGAIAATTSTVSSGFTYDYNKIASDNGRQWVEVKNRRTAREPSTLGISDKYVLNSQINGTSRIQNLYAIPPNRSPVRKLVGVGASNLMLAIHERSVTALSSYSGDNILNTSDGSQLLGDGKGIFGYDNEISGEFGTIYPESVVAHGSRVYWFDPYKAEVLRYANGIAPIGSLYKMRSFFKTKGSQFIDTSNRRVYGGYDPNLHMYILCFRSNTGSEEATVGFIDKPGEERWISFYEYRPERLVKINNRSFYFLSGVMYELHSSATYNNFNGAQTTMRFKHVFNSEPDADKILQNLSTVSSSAWRFNSILVPHTGGRPTQETELTKAMFNRRDDVFYADLRRDKNTFGMSSPTSLIAGAIMIGKTYEVNAINDDTTLSELSSINYGYEKSSGHKIV